MNYLYLGSDFSSSMTDALSGSVVAVIIAFILALVGSILLFVLFLPKANENKFHGFLGYMYDFLHFKKLVLEAILKFLYVFGAIYTTLAGVFLLFINPLTSLAMLIGGNILLRVGYEFALLIIMICKNTSEINKKLSAGASIAPVQEVPAQAAPLPTPVSAPAAAAFCGYCGKKLNPDETVCPQCGKTN